MPVSTLALISEIARQRVNSDENYLKRMLYFFELRVPAEVGANGDTDFLFPLILPPGSITLEEPFTVEATPTLGGGLYVEENGIVQRVLRISGNTGFKPRNLNFPSSKSPVPATLPPEKISHTRELPLFLAGAISGQRHFQYLQDSIFRTYADLKRDPAFAADTSLIFHNPRDSEHWLVVPRSFRLQREASNRFLYNYEIELLIVDRADARNADFSDDKSIFDAIRDSIRAAKNAIDRITGMLQDLTAMVGEVTRFVKDAGKIIDAVTGILDAATDFVNGVTELIQAPFASLESTLGLIDSATAYVTANVEQLGVCLAFPEKVVNKFRQLGDALEVLGMTPTDWETPAEATVRKIREQQELRSQLGKKEQAATESPSNFDELADLGTAWTPGDVLLAEGAVNIGPDLRQFRSARQVDITAGDTLITLAARHMGDARLWQHLAILNGLRPPFIDEHAAMPLVAGYITGTATGADLAPFSGALGVGQKILIPSGQKSAADTPILPVQGVAREEPVENHFLGVDLLLESVTGNEITDRSRYDIAIDEEGGSVDARLAEGVTNLLQLCRTRLVTEKGTDLLYQNLGLRRVIALNFTDVDLETARFRVLESLGSDPRIMNVQSIQLEQNVDALEVDVVILIRGLSEPRTLTVRL